MACKSQARFEPGTWATVLSSWIWDISVLDHSDTTAGWLLELTFLKYQVEVKSVTIFIEKFGDGHA